MQLYADLLVTRRDGFVQTQESMKVNIAIQLGGEFLDLNPPGSCVENKGSRHTSGKRVQQELHWIGTFVIAQ